MDADGRRAAELGLGEDERACGRNSHVEDLAGRGGRALDPDTVQPIR